MHLYMFVILIICGGMCQSPCDNSNAVPQNAKKGIIHLPYDTVHTVRILQSPPDPTIFHERGKSRL